MDYKRFLSDFSEASELYMIRTMVYLSWTVPGSIELASGMPNPETVPFSSATFKCKDGTELHVDEDTMRKITPYQQPRGMDDLLKWISIIHKEFHNPPKMGAAKDGSQWGASVCPGALGGMDFLFQAILEENDVVLLDEFAFGGTKKLIRKMKSVYLGVPMDGEGLVPDKLGDILDRWEELSAPIANGRKMNKPKVLVTTPVGQNPTGVNTTLERKQEIYKIAQEYDLLIVEDDPYYYLQYGKTYIPSYQSLDVDGRVIRLDSMSKFITPSMRIGWMTGPEAIIERASGFMGCSCMSLSCFSEIATLKYFDSLGLEGFRNRVKYLSDFYKERRDMVEGLVKTHLTGIVSWTTPTAGMYIWLNLLNTDDSMFLADEALCRKYKVFVVPGIDFACDLSKTYSQVRLCFARTTQADFEKGIPLLARFITENISRKV
ncbi:kynurenine/alpha-aminoadipate aminotransferase, mitochondrial-like [Ciona intestinalis]